MTVNGTSINATEHFAVSYNGNDVILTVVSGMATTSSVTAGVQQSPLSSGRTKLINVGLPMLRNGAVAGLPSGFNRDRRQVFGVGNLTALTHQIASPHSAPAANLNFGVTGRTERPPLLALRNLRQAGPPEALRMSRGFVGRMVPRPALASPRSHGTGNHRTMELGLDLLSFVGNPRHLMRSLYSQIGPANATDLTFLTFNGYR